MINTIESGMYANGPVVNLSKYVKLGDGKWRYCPVATSANGRVKPDHVVINDRAEVHKEGSYYIDWNEASRRRRQSVGKDAVDAQAARQRQEQLLRNKMLGIRVVGEDGSSRTRLGTACDDFLEEILINRRPKTFHQYEVAIRYLQQSCKKTYLAEIDRHDLIVFVGFLRTTKKLSQRTIWTKLNIIIQMLKANGITGLIRKRDWPRFVEAEPEIYSLEELDKFFAACSAEERLLFEFFLMTGFREAEVQFVTWKDVDLKEQIVRVTAKREHGFYPKDWEEREVPIPDRLARALKPRARFQLKSPLVFATPNNRPNGHFLRQVKAIAFRAGLNCGNCDNGRKLCAFGPHCDAWYLHKFRATFATMHLRAGVDLSTVQHWMGHKDLASTMRYLKPARGKGVQEKVNNTFQVIQSATEAQPSV